MKKKNTLVVKKTPKKIAKKVAPKKVPAKKTTVKKELIRTPKKSRKQKVTIADKSLFSIGIKSTFIPETVTLQAREIKYMAICTFEHKNLTDWTDETTADNAADSHSETYSHPVTVLEMH